MSWEVKRFYLSDCSKLLSCRYSPTVEGPRKSGFLHISQEFFQCGITNDLKNAPSFIFLKKSQGRSVESLRELLSPCSLNPWLEQSGWWSYLSQGGDHSRNDPRSVSGFLRLCSWMYPERFRFVPRLVDSKELSSSNKAPRAWLFVLLKCWDFSFVTLPCVPLDTWVMYCSLILWTAERREWLFPGDPSWITLATADNFLLLAKVAILKRNCRTVLKTESSFFLKNVWGGLGKYVANTTSSKRDS